MVSLFLPTDCAEIREISGPVATSPNCFDQITYLVSSALVAKSLRSQHFFELCGRFPRIFTVGGGASTRFLRRKHD